MRKGGLADSPFFYQSPQPTPVSPPPPKAPANSEPSQPVKPRVSRPRQTTKPKAISSKKTNLSQPKRNQEATVIPRHHDTTVSRYHDTMVETVRVAVKQFGKEAATHRFTPEEKKAIADIIYTYKMRGIGTSENQLTRIGVHFLLEDYEKNGENSLLDRVLKALNK